MTKSGLASWRDMPSFPASVFQVSWHSGACESCRQKCRIYWSVQVLPPKPGGSWAVSWRNSGRGCMQDLLKRAGCRFGDGPSKNHPAEVWTLDCLAFRSQEVVDKLRLAG